MSDGTALRRDAQSMLTACADLLGCGCGHRVRTFAHACVCAGDFRWSRKMTRYPALANMCLGHSRHPRQVVRPVERLDVLYLDTTYCDPNYAFPAQETTILAVVEVARKYVRDMRWCCLSSQYALDPMRFVCRYANRPDVLLLFGCYTIGKERLFMEVAAQLNERVCVPWKVVLSWVFLFFVPLSPHSFPPRSQIRLKGSASHHLVSGVAARCHGAAHNRSRQSSHPCQLDGSISCGQP